jgi:hypothetical protein
MILKRWVVVLVGIYSGNVTPLDFCRFWTRRGAQQWADQLTGRGWFDVDGAESSTRFEVRSLPL